jgi:hypothetical protein
MASRALNCQHASLVALCISLAISALLPSSVYAQAKGTKTSNPVVPMGLGPAVNVPRPIRWGVPPPGPSTTERVKGEKVIQSLAIGPAREWSFSLSPTYQFLDERSRVGGISSDTNSVTVDFNITHERSPYTSFDLSYSYFNLSGSSPTGLTETAHQNLGSVYILQPLEPFFPCGRDWQPAYLSCEVLNNQVAVIAGANYGVFRGSLNGPQSFSVHNSGREFLGNAFLDYQCAYFPDRRSWKTNPPSSEVPDDYATFFFDFSSGVRVDALGVDSSGSPASASRQVTYQNIAVLNYSCCHRFGVLVAVEWDAPIDSSPLRQSRAYYANTAIFTAGLTYNYYPGRRSSPTWVVQDHLSVSLLYSYLAFDPFTEGNQLQVRFSYAF